MNKKITREIILYGIFGVLTTLINILAYNVCYYTLNVSNVVSTAVAWFLSVAFAYVTNRIWVFESDCNNTLKEAFEFFICRLATGILDILIMHICVDVYNLEGGIIKILSNVLVIVLNYLASKLYIFKK